MDKTAFELGRRPGIFREHLAPVMISPCGAAWWLLVVAQYSNDGKVFRRFFGREMWCFACQDWVVSWEVG